MTPLSPYLQLVRWHRWASWLDFPSTGPVPQAAAAMPAGRHSGWDNIHAQSHASGNDGITGPHAEYVADSPWATDEDGYYKWPLKAALASVRKSNPEMAKFLRALPGVGYDPLEAVEAVGNPLLAPNADAYALRALATLRMRYITRPR